MEIEKLNSEMLRQFISADFRCQNCGRGYRHRDKTGERLWCKRCINIYFRKESLTPEDAERTICDTVERLYERATLDDFDDEIKQQVTAIKPGDDLFIFGPPGTGKTHLLAALIRQNVYEGLDCRRINFDDFVLLVRSTMSPASKLTEWDLVEPMKNIDLLVIDDLGLRSKMESDFSFTTLYSILNKRQERLLPTFVSSNKNISRLEQAFDSRIASRLQTAVIIEMTGTDKRRSERIAPVSSKQSSANIAPLGEISSKKGANIAPGSANTAPLKGANIALIDNSNDNN